MSGLVFASMGAGGIHYARCWGCMTGACYDVPTWHGWADADDLEHGENTGQDVEAIKRQRCACACAVNDDPEPQPGDSPDYHADHAYWRARHAETHVPEGDDRD